MNAEDKTTEAVMYDAIEGALWQDLADALNRLSEWGVDPLLHLADRLGVNGVRDLDPLERGHMLHYQPPFQPDPKQPGTDLPVGWQVVRREPEAGERP